MTVSSSINRWAYIADGTTVAFAYENLIFADGDLKVYVDGAAALLGTDYVVAGAGSNAGGTVTFNTPPTAGAQVAIVRDVPFTQGLDLAPLGSFPAEELEKALDRAVILSHQLLDGVDRVLRQPDTDAVAIGRLPAKGARAGQYLAFDANGDPMPSAGTSTPAISPYMATVIDDLDPASARASLGLGTAAVRDEDDFVAPGDLIPLEQAIDAVSASQSAIQVAMKYAGY